MDIDIKNVHIGEAIEKRRNELGLSKSELGRKIGAATACQPHTGEGDYGDQTPYQGQ